ncbi:ABC transporter ATP-binding protein [Psychrobacillus lasiicapitis]|uniref:ABC transporter ATP-binding protein n=1 Tax=Psychrobacillus lasiicapitis TaxID=1636719 RepID=A0A544TCF3_9BACI|nr:ABC transporter ATP-binding protein [Psychrobacillus lasiicapitis]TQR15138.1 ABC transporter ATP-binding protein [Psychrobacillus lasiicapitis]GGA22780.1 ABC transporter ATP-binding protein [Psychrobacillus lasiicapitis]
MDKVIAFKDVSWRRSGQEILSQINWEVKENEHWAILGLNGSGKTSLLNIVNGYNFPSTGNVSVLGHEFGRTNLPELRKEIGYVSSSLERFSQILERETVEEIIVSGKFASFGLYEKVSNEDWEKADALLSALRLDYLNGKSYNSLSQGERRRVLIARALMSDPKILILDEPCTGLDVFSREEVLFLMNEIVQNDCHLLYVTHHIEEIVDVISHVILLRDGKIVASGPKEEVLTDELLSEAYKMPVKIRWEEDRPWLTIQKDFEKIKFSNVKTLL